MALKDLIDLQTRIERSASEKELRVLHQAIHYLSDEDIRCQDQEYEVELSQMLERLIAEL